MKLAKFTVNDRTDFHVTRDPQSWTPVSSCGVEVADLPALIEEFSSVEDGLAGSRIESMASEPRLECPIVRPSKVLAIGLNYMDHIREQGAEPPHRPVVFAKYTNALTGPFDPIVVEPELTEQADYEAELGVVIGRRCRKATRANALDFVFGYTVANDVSARDWQRLDAQFSRSKSMDTFCPIGPWITTADEIPDPQALGIRSFVNGEPRQDSTTREMVFDVAYLIEFLSRTMTLEPGDVILTGTPHGVGFAMEPPRFLKAGDVVRCEIDGLGAIENPVSLLPAANSG